MMSLNAAKYSDATRKVTREVVTVNQMISNAASNPRVGMNAATYSMRMMRDVIATRLKMKNAASNSTVRSAATRH